MTFLIYTLHVLICLFLIAVVLLQQGKGADLSVFGGGGTQTAFGARGAATVLHKMTVGSFIAFIATTMIIGVLQTQNEGSEVFGGLPDAVEESAEAEEPAAEEAGALPTDVVEDDAATDDAGTEDAANAAEGDSPDAEPAGDDTAEPVGGDTDDDGDDASQTEG